MERDFESKYEYVKDWLGRVYSSSQSSTSTIPDIDPSTINELYSLAMESVKSERRAVGFIEHMEQRIQHYERETSNLVSVQEAIGVTINDLPPDTQEGIEALAKAASILECNDTSSTSILLALSHNQQTLSSTLCLTQELSRELVKVEEEIRQAQAEKDRLSHLADEINNKKRSLDHELPQTMNETNFLKQKKEQYQTKLTSLEDQLKKNKYSTNIKHSTLETIDKEIRSVEEKLLPLIAELDHYKQLPPNLEMAQLKIHEKKLELATLEKEVSCHIDLIDAEN